MQCSRALNALIQLSRTINALVLHSRALNAPAQHAMNTQVLLQFTKARTSVRVQL